MMRLLIHGSLVVVVAAGLVVSSSHAQVSDTNVAQASAESWLSLIDNQRYAASWDEAAGLFKSAVTQDTWRTAAEAARRPLGTVKSRALFSATATKAIPGAPPGDYVVFQFNAVFEQRPSAIETITTIRESDGVWRVGGYFIK